MNVMNEDECNYGMLSNSQLSGTGKGKYGL